MICSKTIKYARKRREQLLKQKTRRIYHATPFTMPTPKSVIPLHIYQVWHDLKEMPQPVKESTSMIKEQNPEFEYHLYDEHVCRSFIKNNFSKKVVDAYDSIMPHAYKADLWRYCILYKKGGIYLDSKYYGVEGFKLIQLTGKEYFCKDVPWTFGGIYNAILICKPKNKIMLQCIQRVVKQVEEQYYGSTPWCIGPLMMRYFFTKDKFDALELEFEVVNKVKRFILYKGHRILKYNEAYKALNDWRQYWKERKLYR